MKSKVSIWLGDFENEEQFYHYMNLSYTEDGDLIPSAFMNDFNIEDYDDDFQEIYYFEKPEDKISVILNDFLYSEIL